ncbi:23488_t:CDS:2, partial [Gigaspora margarita]
YELELAWPTSLSGDKIEEQKTQAKSKKKKERSHKFKYIDKDLKCIDETRKGKKNQYEKRTNREPKRISSKGEVIRDTKRKLRGWPISTRAELMVILEA